MRYIVLILILAQGLQAQVNPKVIPLDATSGTVSMDTVKYEKQEDLEVFETTVDGHVMTAMITEDGDTLIMATLKDVSITTPRTFSSAADYRKYMKFRRYAAIVYPYAKEAIRIFKETEHVTNTMKRRKRKKHIKNCLLYTSPSPRDATLSRMPSSA